MVKIIKTELFSCLDCPNYGERGGYCLLVKGDNRGHRSVDNFPFPKWCPLPDKEKQVKAYLIGLKMANEQLNGVKSNA